MVRRMAAILACVPIALPAAAGALPVATDLTQDMVEMRGGRVPMVVLFSQAGCSHCETARRYLVPMSASEAHGRRALFRQIDIDSDAALVDFSGARSTHRAVAAAQQVSFTPTVRVFGADGRALGDDIVGIGLEDFYGHYVDNAIDGARRHMGASD
jgi:glutaredoxin